MPEGPEIRRAADQVAAAIKGKKVERLFFAFEHLKAYEQQLAGTTVQAVDTFGKAMLTRFSNGMNIYSHNQLYGRWYCTKAGEQPDIGRQLRLAIYCPRDAALLYSASEISVLLNDEIGNHPFIKKLGPDVLHPDTEMTTITRRLREKRFHKRQLGSLLTDQSFVAGLGNYLRCEILFVAGLSPTQRPKQLDNYSLEQLATAILELPRQSYQSGGITNELSRARQLIEEGASFEEARFHLFRREGKPCYHCGTAIVRTIQAGQPTYLCPHCQKFSV
ncbi:MAG TPA: endonuclease VIII [Gammaproteobacteria bacterium]|nr:endonuclease VIII [Gammaproteobacteria bacterium]